VWGGGGLNNDLTVWLDGASSPKYICKYMEISKLELCFGHFSAWILNKDTTVWLEGARTPKYICKYTEISKLNCALVIFPHGFSETSTPKYICKCTKIIKIVGESAN
jgi:hypothetical protein